MASIIIYLADKTHLDRTLDEIIDKTPSHLLEEIIICDDNGQDYRFDTGTTRKIIKTNSVGRAAAWNQAAKEASSETLIFLRDTTKFGEDWLQPLLSILDEKPKSLVSPRVHTLDTALWATEDECWSRFGWRWDMVLYDRQHIGKPESPAISNYCIVTNKAWFDEIGGFDEGMKGGAGEDIELSLRTWLFGGSVLVSDNSYIAVRHQVDVGKRSINNAARIVEAWLSPYAGRFFGARDVSPNDVRTGRLNNLLRLQSKQVRSAEWFIDLMQPELGRVYDLRNSAAGKSVGIIGWGYSLDLIDQALINRCDILIGVDYMGLSNECDYVVTDSANVVVELKAEYDNSSFIVPFYLMDKASASYIPSGEVVDGCVQFELMKDIGKIDGVSPPFCNFEQSLHTAVQLALFLGPRSVTLFGCDNKLISGRSHSAKIGYYDDGCLWSDSEATRQRYSFFEYGVIKLGNLAASLGIPLLRMNHA